MPTLSDITLQKLCENSNGTERNPDGDLTYTVQCNGYIHMLDDNGMHRIVAPDGTCGDWAMYSGIAVHPNENYFAVTAYYDGTLPIETIMEYNI